VKAIARGIIFPFPFMFRSDLTMPLPSFCLISYSLCTSLRLYAVTNSRKTMNTPKMDQLRAPHLLIPIMESYSGDPLIRLTNTCIAVKTKS
jgi:hypothetical protein